MGQFARSFTIFLMAFMTLSGAYAQSTDEGPVVTLGVLNKITAKMETIKVGRDQMVKFGTLEITMRECRSNPPEETPESVAFLEIIDLGHVGNPTPVFTGWMFASSPAVSSLEHAVYDVWVTDCKMADGDAVSAKR